MISRLICLVFGHRRFLDLLPDNVIHPWRRAVPGEPLPNQEEKVGRMTGYRYVRSIRCSRCMRDIPARGAQR